MNNIRDIIYSICYDIKIGAIVFKFISNTKTHRSGEGLSLIICIGTSEFDSHSPVLSSPRYRLKWAGNSGVSDMKLAFFRL